MINSLIGQGLTSVNPETRGHGRRFVSLAKNNRRLPGVRRMEHGAELAGRPCLHLAHAAVRGWELPGGGGASKSQIASCVVVPVAPPASPFGFGGFPIEICQSQKDC